VVVSFAGAIIICRKRILWYDLEKHKSSLIKGDPKQNEKAWDFQDGGHIAIGFLLSFYPIATYRS
jgi:hypothetical protein